MQSICNIRVAGDRPVPSSAPEGRLSLIRLLEKKWVNGTVLKYAFFKSGPEAGSAQFEDLVRRGFRQWKELGIGLSFLEVSDLNDADVRVGFVQGDGSWSYVGRDVFKADKTDRTMNFGWDVSQDYDAVLHEIGHTLGLPHEHQNPFAGIVWNEESVYKSLAGPPNSWPREQTYYNIIRKLSQAEVSGSKWDPNSIMHYPFEPGMILEPEQYYATGLQPTPGFSQLDIETVRVFYPPLDDAEDPLLEPNTTYQARLAPGEQVNLRVQPPAAGNFTFQTIGKADTVMVLFDAGAEPPVAIAADDDSGIDANAQFQAELQAGGEYILRVRLYYSDDAASFGVQYF